MPHCHDTNILRRSFDATSLYTPMPCRLRDARARGRVVYERDDAVAILRDMMPPRQYIAAPLC